MPRAISCRFCPQKFRGDKQTQLRGMHEGRFHKEEKMAAERAGKAGTAQASAMSRKNGPGNPTPPAEIKDQPSTNLLAQLVGATSSALTRLESSIALLEVRRAELALEFERYHELQSEDEKLGKELEILAEARQKLHSVHEHDPARMTQ